MESELYVIGDEVVSQVIHQDVNSSMDAVIVGKSLECSDTIDMDIEEGNRKRVRESNNSSEGEEWQTITRGRKIIRQSDQVVEEMPQVYVTCSTVLPKQIALARLFQQHGIIGVYTR